MLCLAPFDTEAEAIALANDSDYGLTSYVQTADAARARRVSRALRAGMVEVNGKVCWRPLTLTTPILTLTTSPSHTDH